MKTRLLTTLLILTGLWSCTEASKTIENKTIQRDTIQTDFIFSESKDSVIKNGEYIKYYKNGVIEMRGMMKEGKREGLWKSWYEDGSPFPYGACGARRDSSGVVA